MKIKTVFLQILLVICPGLIYFQGNASTAEHKISINIDEEYQCMPCGSDCDKEVYTGPGKCKHCNMDLVKKSTVNFKSIQPSQICKYITDHPDVVLLDVRTKDEFDGKKNPDFGTLKNAINLPIQELKEKISTINHLKDKEIIVYCSHSHRSPRASYILTQNGFTNITNLDGGMSVLNDNTCKK